MLKDNLKILRKNKGLSQEELSIKLHVVRQTVSKWESGLSVPDAEMLMTISEILETPVSEILGESIEEKEKNDLKVIGFVFIGYIIFMIIAVIGLGTYTVAKKDNANVESSATTICSIDNKKYQIEFGTNNYFKCNNCSKKMSNEINEIVDFNNINNSMINIENYFKNNNGTCE